MKKLLLVLFLTVLAVGCDKGGNGGGEDPNVQFEVSWPARQFFEYGETMTFDYTVSDAKKIDVTELPGWTVTAKDGIVSIKAPNGQNPTNDAMITVSASAGLSVVKKHILVSCGYVVGFEDAAPSSLGGPTAAGENLYSSYTGGTQIIGNTNSRAGLYFPINATSSTPESTVYDYYSGGTALSQWNNMEVGTDANQLSVYYNSSATGKGGHDGSATFAVLMGANNTEFGGVDSRASIRNTSAGTFSFEYMWVMNSTWATLVMKNGNAFARAFGPEDWLLLTIQGYNASDAPIQDAVVNVYLADFRAETGAPGIMEEWTKVDLRPLKSVSYVKFDFTGSDTGAWGLNTPAYVCIDDIAVIK